MVVIFCSLITGAITGKLTKRATPAANDIEPFAAPDKATKALRCVQGVVFGCRGRGEIRSRDDSVPASSLGKMRHRLELAVTQLAQKPGSKEAVGLLTPDLS